MSYTRVIPRDLFNEGDLLNCLGRLSIKLADLGKRRAYVAHYQLDSGFFVRQDESDGSIYCSNVVLFIGVRPAHLFRPLNSRSKWPLYCRAGQYEVRVFDEGNGALTPEFIDLITTKEDVK